MTGEEIFIGRQPILDREHQLFAYELLFRSGNKVNAASIQDNMSATASVINSLLISDILEVLPTDKIVLEVLETVEVTPQIVERCQELKARGFTIALDDFVNYEEKFKPLLDLIEIVKVDLLPLDSAGLAATTSILQKWPSIKLLAEKVDSREQAKYCHDLGYALFQGYYFAKPAIIAGKKLGHSQLSLVRLLGLVLEDAETPLLEGVLKHEPGLAMNLMRLTNSVATGIRTKVTSLRHAITILGRRQLQRWLQLLLYTNPQADSISNPLLPLAATRGRLMELLAGKLHPGRREFEDHAFMTGIMSLMPTLMGAPLEEILRGISIAGNVRDALEKGEGDLGVMLLLAQALETGDGPACHDLTEKLGSVDHMMVNACLTQALTWAANIGKEQA
ncbi:MAG: EAL domain-containing protein [Rhodocyclales bacterium]|nr:EAL domain-containing protein [Rhodocyclales bacterium]